MEIFWNEYALFVFLSCHLPGKIENKTLNNSLSLKGRSNVKLL